MIFRGSLSGQGVGGGGGISSRLSGSSSSRRRLGVSRWLRFSLAALVIFLVLLFSVVLLRQRGFVVGGVYTDRSSAMNGSSALGEGIAGSEGVEAAHSISPFSPQPISSDNEDDYVVDTHAPKRNLAREEREGRVELDLEGRWPTVGKPSLRVHIFYYPWYATAEQDGHWSHWNHDVLPSPFTKENPPPHRFLPPEHIGANFYPDGGPYSSTDDRVVQRHMAQLAHANVGVLCTSWYPPEESDAQLKKVPGFTDASVEALLDAAHAHGLKVNFHHEPYKSRSADSFARDVHYIIDRYGDHPALYRHPSNGLPMIYVYDSYLTPGSEWRTVLGDPASHPSSIRGTQHDAMVIGLVVDHKHTRDIIRGGFDGFYTYFATTGFTYGSTPKHWVTLKRFADEHELVFIPSVGPGYVDTRIRPWNEVNIRERRDGDYYKEMFGEAIRLQPDVLSITSFNEWHEGTQIEPAVSMRVKDDGSGKGEWFEYEDYGRGGKDFYLGLTKTMVDRYRSLVGDHS